MSTLMITCVRVCVCVCVCVCVLEGALSPNCCLLSHCQSDYEILFNLLGGGVLCDFDESDLLFLHSRLLSGGRAPRAAGDAPTPTGEGVFSARWKY